MTVKEASTPPVVYTNLSDIDILVNTDRSMSLESMPVSYSIEQSNSLPTVVLGETHKEQLPDGRTIDVPSDIQWLNRERFVYANLDVEDRNSSPAFAQGYRVVTRDCEAARDPEGRLIHESFWGGRDYIKNGPSVLHYCLKSFAQAHKEETNRIAIERTNAFMPGNATKDVVSDSGERAGGVVGQSYEFLGLTDPK